ncbi:hypothetical protein B566_EDAN013150 [Ephemera danica]|nr:hypothetical protein B566_EDAN013150 [Ephemera danica]
MARPLPVEYLLVDVPASTPLTPQFTFEADSSPLNLRPFPVENRLVDGHIQDFSALCSYMQQFGLSGEASHDDVQSENFLTAGCMDPLLRAVRDRDSGLAWQWSRSEHWATVEQLMIASASSPAISPITNAASSSVTAPVPRPRSASLSSMEDVPPQIPPMPAATEPWTCNYCTFVNQPHRSSCEMCNLPR